MAIGRPGVATNVGSTYTTSFSGVLPLHAKGPCGSALEFWLWGLEAAIQTLYQRLGSGYHRVVHLLITALM